MSATPARPLTVEHARLFDPRTERVAESMIHIADGVVTALGGPVPADADVVDAGGRLVVAGLIDAHFHAYGIGLDVLAIESAPASYVRGRRSAAAGTRPATRLHRPSATWPAVTSASPARSTRG